MGVYGKPVDFVQGVTVIKNGVATIASYEASLQRIGTGAEKSTMPDKGKSSKSAFIPPSASSSAGASGSGSAVTSGPEES